MAEEQGFFQDGSADLAAAWERYREEVFTKTREVSDWIVEHVDAKPGQTILEVAAGPGETGFLAAERVGPDGRLISTDFSQGMVDAARRGAEARGLQNVECRPMDAQQLDLPDASVDGVISRFGVMLLPEPHRAVAEFRRVLRPGGRLAYGVWGPPDRNPWLVLLVGAVLSQGLAPQGGNPFGPGGPFSLATPESNRELLEAGGFSDLHVEEIDGAMHFETSDDYWDMQTAIAGPLATLLASISDEQRDAIRAGLEPTLEPYRSDKGLALPWAAVGVSATV
jgi:ubiquinone/menaquinone biosynthesis C-methylase UbiE